MQNLKLGCWDYKPQGGYLYDKRLRGKGLFLLQESTQVALPGLEVSSSPPLSTAIKGIIE